MIMSRASFYFRMTHPFIPYRVLVCKREMCSALSAFAYIYPDEPYVDPPTREHGFKAHAVHNLRSFVAVVAQNAVWLGTYDCMENFSPTTLDRELCFLFSGVALMIGTRYVCARGTAHSPTQSLFAHIHTLSHSQSI